MRSAVKCAFALAVMAAVAAAATQCANPSACTEMEVDMKVNEAVQEAVASTMKTLDYRTGTTHRRLLDSVHNNNNVTPYQAMSTLWLLVCAILVFFMQCGFAMVESGAVRHSSVKSILFKNLLDPCFGAIAFWAVGYGFAYGAGDDANVFIGNKYFFLSLFESADTYANFFFQFAFAATAATIVSGAVAERCEIKAFFLYNIVLCSFVYPVVVHWVWSFEGWLSAWNAGAVGELLSDIGMVDFAGCGVVHMVGGLSGLIGAKILGPRSGEWKKYGTHNAPLVCFGTFILWVGWYGFNCGSTLIFGSGDGSSHLAAKVAVTTTLSAASSGITACFVWNALGEAWSVERTCNGILSGLVGITAACSVVQPWAAVVTGVISGLVYTLSSILVKDKLEIDDVLDAAPVHYFCGIWGLLSAALFADEDSLTLAAYPVPTEEGLFIGGGGKRLGVAVAGIVAISAWVFVTMGTFFYFLDKMGGLRVSFESEVAGLDKTEFGGPGYDQSENNERGMVRRHSWSSKKGEDAEKAANEMSGIAADAIQVATPTAGGV